MIEISEGAEPQFPVNEFYKDHIAAGVTIKQTARNWVAALLVKDPRSGLESVRIYQWHRSSNDRDWKRRGVITLDRSEQVRDLSGTLQKFAHAVAEAQISKLKQKTDGRAKKVMS